MNGSIDFLTFDWKQESKSLGGQITEGGSGWQCRGENQAGKKMLGFPK
jgi:hypothetical protein